MLKVNGKEVKITNFPNKESLIDMSGFMNLIYNTIECKFESDSDLLHLYMIKKTIDNQGASSELIIPYLPYSRMDRTEDTNFCFTLKHLATFINELGFKRVVVAEPHSDVSVALLNNIKVVHTTKRLYDKFLVDHSEMKDADDVYVVFPDAGAEKRYSKQIDAKNKLTAIKHRDFETGYIKSLEIMGKTPTEPFKAIIVDDLSSKGGTFILTANKLKEMGATEIYLIVSHCENTIYDGDVLKVDSNITEVYTTDSILDKKDEGFRKWNPQLNLDKLHIEDIMGVLNE